MVLTVTEVEAFPPGQTALATETALMRRAGCAHTHDFAELAFIRSGRGEQHTEQGVTPLQEGSLVVLPPGSWHAIEPKDELALTNVYLSSSLLSRELGWMADLPRIGPLLSLSGERSAAVLTLELDPAIHRRAGEALIGLANANGRNLLARMARLFDLLSVLTPALEDVELGRTATVQPLPFEHAAAPSHLVTRYRYSVAHAISLLHDQIDQPWTLEALAREVSLSPSQLARVFRADAGSSPMAYLQQTRAERMAYLLRTTDLTVAAAARAVGWDDASYAARRFRAHWDTTPAAYRRRLH